jgi:hypothetical protein
MGLQGFPTCGGGLRVERRAIPQKVSEQPASQQDGDERRQKTYGQPVHVSPSFLRKAGRSLDLYY